MAIVYTPADKIITITGYTESVPCNFTDIYNADKAGTLELMSATTPALNMTLTTQIQPADDIALKIDFIVSGIVAGTIDITGTDKDGNAQSETLTITGAGTYTTTKWFKTITDIDCNGFSSGTLTVRQNRWGVIWIQNTDTFRIECRLDFGVWNGSTATYFTDTKKNVIINALKFITASGQYLINTCPNTFLIFGETVSVGNKTTRYGCNFYAKNQSGFYGMLFSPRGQMQAYSCTFACENRADMLMSRNTEGTESRFWNCYFKDGISFADMTSTDVYNLNVIYGASVARRPRATTTIEKVVGNYGYYGVWFQHHAGLVRDVWCRNYTYAFRMESIAVDDDDCYIIDGDFNSWAGNWSNTHADRRMYRQHTLNLKVLDKDNNPIENVVITLKDKDGTLIANAEKFFNETDLEESESFETGFGNWVSSGTLGWTRRTGSTGSSGTGPSSAYNGNYYIYTEASGNYYKSSILTYNGTLPVIGGIKFRYHKYGSTCGELSVDAYYSGAWNQIWSTPAGNEGDVWKEVKLDFPAGTTNVRINSETGSSSTGDTALDLIKIYNDVMQERYYFDTDENGIIPEQIVSYGYYKEATGNTINSYSPHTLEIKKSGYKTYKTKFTMDEKINWRIRLEKVLDMNTSKLISFNNQ